MKYRINFFIFIILTTLLSCNSGDTAVEVKQTSDEMEFMDPLPSWSEGSSKSAILNFVQEVTREGEPNFIPKADRIATFDNDGTLWSEQPAYFQLYFAIDRIKVMANDHPEWSEQQPYKAILENDMETLHSQGMNGIVELVMASHAGMSTSEFDQIVSDWLTTARHPETDLPYTSMVYQPMLELLDYLEANGFTTYIVSGGGMEFIRAWSDEVYGIPANRVIGSTIKTTFEMIDGTPQLTRLPELDFIDDKEGKPVAINRYIGKKPVIAVGNSDGDLPMLQWTASNSRPNLEIYVHHTDSVREWAYDRESSIGHFDKGLDEAQERNWLIVDMANDWEKIYPDSE